MRIIMEWEDKLYELKEGVMDCPKCSFNGQSYCSLHGLGQGKWGHCNRAALSYTEDHDVRGYWRLLE